MSVSKLAFPDGVLASDLTFNEQIESMIGDEAFMGAGNYSEVELDLIMADKDTLIAELGDNLASIGELAEKPGKMDSKLNKLKTRNYTVPGKRTNTIELTINGLSTKQKKYLESTGFSSTETSVILVNSERDRAIVMTGMRWTCDWSGEVDGLFSVVISTEYSGSTDGRVFLYKDIPDAA